jgi:hypothetical protein
MARQACTGDTVLVKSREMTGRSKTLQNTAGRRRGKYDRKQNTLAPLAYRSRIQRKIWCIGPYAGVDYNLTLCPLQSSRSQHIYRGQPYMPKSTLTLRQSRLYPPVRDRILHQYRAVAKREKGIGLSHTSEIWPCIEEKISAALFLSTIPCYLYKAIHFKGQARKLGGGRGRGAETAVITKLPLRCVQCTHFALLAARKMDSKQA